MESRGIWSPGPWPAPASLLPRGCPLAAGGPFTGTLQPEPSPPANGKALGSSLPPRGFEEQESGCEAWAACGQVGGTGERLPRHPESCHLPGQASASPSSPTAALTRPGTPPQALALTVPSAWKPPAHLSPVILAPVQPAPLLPGTGFVPRTYAPTRPAQLSFTPVSPAASRRAPGTGKVLAGVCGGPGLSVLSSEMGVLCFDPHLQRGQRGSALPPARTGSFPRQLTSSTQAATGALLAPSEPAP